MLSKPSKLRSTVNRSRRSQKAASAPTGVSGFMAVQRNEPFPPRRVFVFKYGDVFTSTTNAAASLFGTQIDIKLNSIFAPIAGGHQPYGRDSLALIYQRYAVLRAKVKLTLMASTLASPVMFAAAYTLPGFLQSMTGSGFSTIADQPATRVGMQGGPAAPPLVWEFTFDLAKMVGLTHSEYVADTADYGSVQTASPAQSFFLSIAAANTVAVAEGWSMQYELQLETELYDRVLQPQS